MIKKIFILFSLTFFIYSCGSEVEDTISTTWLIKAETNNISIDIPENWEIIEDKKNILPKAKDSEIEMAATSKIITNGFANNILILSANLNTYVSSSDFSMLNNIWAQTDYLDYTRLGSKEFKFLDEEKSILYTFEAKYNIETPKLKFMQTAYICNQTKAYFITIAIPTNIIDTSKYEEFLSTFTCK